MIDDLDEVTLPRRRFRRHGVSQAVLGVVVFGIGAAIAGAMATRSLDEGSDAEQVAALPLERPVLKPSVHSPYGELPVASRAFSAALRLDPVDSFSLRWAFDPNPMPVAEAPTLPEQKSAEQAVPLPRRPAATLAENAPLPPSRPSELGALNNEKLLRPAPRRLAQRAPATPPTPVATADNRGFFEKLFGGSQQPAGQTLAYARPDDGVIGAAPKYNQSGVASGAPANVERYTAIYDISAHTVILPNGEKLEAHSGLGARLDDPRHVHEKMRGATPPHVYELEPRKDLFHGVQALRLNPIGGEGAVYGRTGLLAHTFMLGPNGDSNGCVSFRNYNRFLQAYQNGEVKRLLVVASRS